MQITKLIPNPSFSGLVAFSLVAMIAVLVNKPDPDLEQRVSDLENRVALIEDTLSGTDSIVTPDRGWQDVENWRQLSEGMSEDQVQKLLGRPIRIDGGRSAIWHYSPGGGYSSAVDECIDGLSLSKLLIRFRLVGTGVFPEAFGIPSDFRLPGTPLRLTNGSERHPCP